MHTEVLIFAQKSWPERFILPNLQMHLVADGLEDPMLVADKRPRALVPPICTATGYPKFIL